MELSTVKKVHALKREVHDKTSQYYHSTQVAETKSKIVFKNQMHSFSLIYGLRDLLLIGALTESPVLLTGGTDLGKTTLAKLVMNSLFGAEEDGWHRLDFDLDFGKDSVQDVNSSFFLESGKTLSDLYSLHKWMRLPGFIADELNGAHAKVIRKALHIIKEKDITLSDGRRVHIGHPLDHGIGDETYQYQIATINEGKEYSGTFDMDKALRRRTTIEVPMDIFKPSSLDRLLLQKTKVGGPMPLCSGHFDDVHAILSSLPSLRLHPLAELFIAYLESFDYCKNSLTGDKGSVQCRNGSIHHICAKSMQVEKEAVGAMGCEFLRSFENDLCSEVRGITPGISENLITVSKGFALLRATKFVEMIAVFFDGKTSKHLCFKISTPWKEFEQSLKQYAGTGEEGIPLGRAAVAKYIDELEVEQEDILAAIPFVGYSKIGMSHAWITRHYQGNKFEAVKSFCRQAELLFKEGMARPELENLQEVLSSQATSEDLKGIEKYCRTSNPWLWRALSPYIELKETTDDSYECLY